ncbi:MAG TPA: right-handed parallel beta-helix repeat-containing protein, partial [Thermoleophilia bacterium]|nr:right-handed parallel beta-helix repeat-containing protein [Thermoleophilia bacterium]
GLSTSVVKIAESYSGADFSDQLQNAAAAAPVGGTVLITESHSVAGTANMDDADTTIACTPGVVLTKTGAANESMFIFSAANPVLRGCHLEGDKNNVNAVGVKLTVGADGALIENNRIIDFRQQGIQLDPAASGALLSGVTIQNNEIRNDVGATGSVVTKNLIDAGSGALVPNLTIRDNFLTSRDSGGNAIFLFVATGSDNVLIDGNAMDVEGRDDSNRVTACTELAIAGASTPGGGTTTADFLRGWRVTNNSCTTRDFTFQSMAPPGMSRGSVFSGNNIYDLGTDTTSTQTRYATEIGNLIEASVTGNVWNGNGRGRSMYLHDSEFVTITGNTFNFQRAPVVGADEAIRIEDRCNGTDSLLTASHITISDNIFRAPTPTSGTAINTIVLRCDGTTTCGTGAFTGTTGVQVENILVSDNVFYGTGSPGGGAVSSVIEFDEVGTEGICDVDDVRLAGNRIDNFDHVLLFDNHVYTETEITDNKLTNILTSEIVTTGTVTGVKITGEGPDPFVTGAQCADGSLWVDTDGATTTTNCAGVNAGDLCVCSGGAWNVGAAPAASNYQWYAFTGNTSASGGCLRANHGHGSVATCTAAGTWYWIDVPPGENLTITDLVCFNTTPGTFTTGYTYLYPSTRTTPGVGEESFGYIGTDPDHWIAMDSSNDNTGDRAECCTTRSGGAAPDPLPVAVATAGPRLLQVGVDGSYLAGGNTPQLSCLVRAGW